jgi:hypothetical protein
VHTHIWLSWGMLAARLRVPRAVTIPICPLWTLLQGLRPRALNVGEKWTEEVRRPGPITVNGERSCELVDRDRTLRSTGGVIRGLDEDEDVHPVEEAQQLVGRGQWPVTVKGPFGSRARSPVSVSVHAKTKSTASF